MPLLPNIVTSRGRPLPLGVRSLQEGLNFCLLCRHGTSVTLVIQSIDENDDSVIARIELHSRVNRTGDHWHVLVCGLPAEGFRYGWKVDGPVGHGHRYDP